MTEERRGVLRRPKMIDHIILEVSDLAASMKFYEQALAPLGYRTAMEIDGMASYGVEGMPDFWIRRGAPSGPVHLAFAGPDRRAVEEFHAAAMSAGGHGSCPPEMRRQIHDNYYAASVFDPDGNNIEAVCHQAE
jgi:catechol 2,3-dioxygenase-like lactoylglutathione lyase family enzyme